MKPRASTATPALSRPRSSVLGMRPMASSRSVPSISVGTAGALDARDDGVAALGKPRAFAVQVNPDSLALQDFLDGGGNILVLARHQARRRLDDRHLAAEASIDLREFEPDIAAPEDHEMRRGIIDVHDRLVGEIAHLLDPWDRRHQGAPADIDEDLLGRQPFRRRPRFRGPRRSGRGRATPCSSASISARSRRPLVAVAETVSLRALTFFMSMPTRPSIVTP